MVRFRRYAGSAPEFPDGSLGDYTYFDIVGDRLRLSAKNSRAEDAPVNKVYYEKIG